MLKTAAAALLTFVMYYAQNAMIHLLLPNHKATTEFWTAFQAMKSTAPEQLVRTWGIRIHLPQSVFNNEKLMKDEKPAEDCGPLRQFSRDGKAFGKLE